MIDKRFARSKRLLPLAALVLSLWCGNAPAQNLLSNPGFEDVGNDGIPVSWQREHNPVLSGPFMVVEDAHEGKRAVCMMTEEWNYERPQFITQAVKLPAGVRTLRLAAWCKGQGMVNLAFRFLKGGEPVQKEKVNFGFGDIEKPVEALNCFALCQTYDLYEAVAKAPEGADAVVVKLGNTIPPLERLNIWGKAWIDAASLTEATNDALALAATPQLAEKLVIPPGVQDVAPGSRLVLQPASFDPSRLIDGDTETTAGFMGGIDRGGTINLLFAKAAPVHSVSLYLRGNATALVVRGDADGDAVYETVLGRSQGLSGKGWLSLPLEQKPVKGIRIQPLAGEILGFRQAAPFATEIKVLAAAKDAAALCPPGWGSLARIAHPARAGTPLSLRPTAMALPELKKPKFRRMVCADLWMWGVNASTKDCKLGDCRNSPAFQHTAEMCKRMGVEAVLVDLSNSSCWDLMPWPSKVCNGTAENHLKGLIDALHAEGFAVFVEIIHNVTPFETIKWHYPEEETSRYPGMKQYPSIIHGNHVRDNWLTIMDEIMACGADGVGLSSDEQYYKGHFMETFPKDDPGRALYRKRFGYDLPEHEEDSLKFRQWIQMRHEGVCDLFGYWSQQLRKKHPKIYTNTMLMSFTAGYSYLTETGVPVDLLGARGGITEIGSDYMGPYGIRMAAAANGWRQATMLHNGDMWPYPPLPDMHFYSTAIWNLMYGAGSVNYWRFNYVVDYGHASALTRAYSMVKELDALGLWDARPPRKIALLSSRASIDWWQIKAWWGKHADPNWDRGLEGQRGWFSDECAFNLLQRNGYAFDWLFLDNLDRLMGLDQCKVLVLPFAYSVGKEAAARIKSAADKGARVILLAGMQGPTDEWGEPHPSPVLKELVDSGKAVVFDEDILAFGSSAALAGKLLKALDDALGPEHPFKLHHYGQSIDATLLEKGDRERFIFLLNYEKKPSTVDIEMALPEGKYEAFARDDNRWYSVWSAGGGKLSHEQLRHFRLILAREQPYVLHIRKAK